MGKNQNETLNDILTEQELLDLLGVKKTFVDNLRRKKGLPFCSLSPLCRIYLVSDVIDFIKNKRRVISGEDTQGQQDPLEYTRSSDL